MRGQHRIMTNTSQYLLPARAAMGRESHRTLLGRFLLREHHTAGGRHPRQGHGHRSVGAPETTRGYRAQARAARSAALGVSRRREMRFGQPQAEAVLAQVEPREGTRTPSGPPRAPQA